MSKHKGRKKRWVEITNTNHVSSCGQVKANPRGKWDAIVKYHKRIEDGTCLGYYEQKEVIGEYRRAREAMMAVEDAAVRIARRKDGALLVELDSSLVSKI